MWSLWCFSDKHQIIKKISVFTKSSVIEYNKPEVTQNYIYVSIFCPLFKYERIF